MSQQTAQFGNSRTTERSNSRTTERDATDVPTAAQDNYPLRGPAPSTPSIHAEDLLQISSVPWTHESDISLNTCASPAAPGSNNLPEQEHALPIASQERNEPNEPTLPTNNRPLPGSAAATTGLLDKYYAELSEVPWSVDLDLSLKTRSSTGVGPSASIAGEEDMAETVQVLRRVTPSSSINKSPSIGLAAARPSSSNSDDGSSMLVPPTYDSNPAIGLFDAPPAAPGPSNNSEEDSSMLVPPTYDSNPAVGLFDATSAALAVSSNSDQGSAIVVSSTNQSTTPAGPAVTNPPEENPAQAIQVPASWEIIKYGQRYPNSVSSSQYLTPTPTVEVPCSGQTMSSVNISPDSTQRSLELGDESSLTPAEMWQTIYDLPEGARRVNAYTKTVLSFRGPERADFLEKFSEYIVAVNERTNTIATIHKNYLDSLSPTDYAAMRTSLPTLHEKVRYDEITEIHMRSMALENRKRNHRKCIADIWGSDWETSLREILPKDYSEGFLWRLARLANEKQQPPCLDQMSLELKRIIAKRVRTPKLSKSELLQSVDIINLMNIIKDSGKLQVLLYPKRLAQDIVSVRNDETAITTIIPDQDMDSTDSSNISPTNLPQTPKVIDDIQPSIIQNSMVAVVISKKRKNLLSPPFSRQKKAKLLPPRIKQSESSQLLPQSDLNRRFFVVDLTIESIHPVLVDEKIDQLKKVAEESSDARVQRNIELASEAVGMIIGGQDKDDRPIAREEILERLQLMWDLLEISPALQEETGNQSKSSSKNKELVEEEDLDDGEENMEEHGNNEVEDENDDNNNENNDEGDEDEDDVDENDEDEDDEDNDDESDDDDGNSDNENSDDESIK